MGDTDSTSINQTNTTTGSLADQGTKMSIVQAMSISTIDPLAIPLFIHFFFFFFFNLSL